jgi:hypothetical protein
MKKLFLLATAAFLVTGVSFAGNEGKGKKKKCAKGKTCCSKDAGAKKDMKECHTTKTDKTVKM